MLQVLLLRSIRPVPSGVQCANAQLTSEKRCAVWMATHRWSIAVLEPSWRSRPCWLPLQALPYRSSLVWTHGGIELRSSRTVPVAVVVCYRHNRCRHDTDAATTMCRLCNDFVVSRSLDRSLSLPGAGKFAVGTASRAVVRLQVLLLRSILPVPSGVQCPNDQLASEKRCVVRPPMHRQRIALLGGFAGSGPAGCRCKRCRYGPHIAR